MNASGTAAQAAKVIGWTILVGILTAVIDNQAAITEWLLQLSPDWLDPLVSKGWAALLSVIMLFVGPRQQNKAKQLGY